MPRVSQEHLDARRRQILDAARVCFIREGFHATSMQDVLREAELSAGAVYRYFKSKDEIILAIATDAISNLARTIQRPQDGELPPLEEAFEPTFAMLEEMADTGFTRLAVQIWSEALRSPLIGEALREAYMQVRRALIVLVEAYQARGRIDEAAEAEEVARVLASLVPGFVLQHALLGDVDAGQFRRGLRALLAAT